MTIKRIGEGYNLRSTVVDFTMRVEVRRMSESAFVGMEVKNNVSLDEIVNSNRTSAAVQTKNRKAKEVSSMSSKQR